MKMHTVFSSLKIMPKNSEPLQKKREPQTPIINFWEILSKGQNDSVQQLKKEWQQPNEVVFDWLKRSYVEIIPERELNSLIESYGDLYFYNGGKVAFSSLRDLLENHFNKTLTGEGARNAIKLQGTLKFKEWAFDPTYY